MGLVALVLAVAVASPLVTDASVTPAGIGEDVAKVEAAAYLSSAPRTAELVAEQWVVTDGDETAWIDARSGALVEIEFAAAER